MRIRCILQGAKGGAEVDVGPLLVSAVWTTHLRAQPGKLVLRILRHRSWDVREGAAVRLYVEGAGRFCGYVFSHSADGGEVVTVTAYDQTRYLKNQDSYVLEAGSCAEVFERICGDYGLRHRVAHAGGNALAAKVYDGKTLADILQDCFDRTLEAQRKLFFMRDDFGTLCLYDAARLRGDLLLSGESLLLDYAYESSIDRETCNQVMLIRERDKKRSVFMAKDEKTIESWGLLRKYERIDAETNDAQARALARQYLALGNRVTRSLTVKALGDFRALCGNGLLLSLRGLDGKNVEKWAVVTEAAHTLRDGMHSMELALEVDLD